MSKSIYPVKLRENVIVDAIFEVRFNAINEFSDLVPGIVRSLFGEFKGIDRFPIADIPSHIRKTDPNLKHQPVMRMRWDDVVLVVGDHSLGLGYGDKYNGWDTFKDHINMLLQWLTSVDNGAGFMIENIERYSFKYVDFIPDIYYSDLTDPFDVQAVLGGEKTGNHNLKLQLERDENFGVSIFEFMNPVQAGIDDRSLERGALIAIDTVRAVPSISLESLLEDFKEHKENMHLKNKDLFFTVLSKELLSNLGAEYE